MQWVALKTTCEPGHRASFVRDQRVGLPGPVHEAIEQIISVYPGVERDMAILGAWITIFIKKMKKWTLLGFFGRIAKSSITFCSGGVLQQMMALINSTHPYLQNKTDLAQKYFETKKLRTARDGKQK